MENCISDLKYECKEIEEMINREKAKLLDLRTELDGYLNNDDVRMGKAMSRRRGRRIEAARDKVGKLTSECDALAKIIRTVEKDNVDMNPQSFRDMKSSLEQVLLDISIAEDDLYRMEGLIREAKEENVRLEKDQKQRFKVFMMDLEAERAENMLALRAEEDELRFSLEVLQADVKKAKDEFSVTREHLARMQALCKEEEKRNLQIQMDLDLWARLQEKAQRDEEKAMRNLAAAKAA